MAARVEAPFPYPGSKHRVAPLVWGAIGADVPRFIEPFAGSLGVLLARPGERDGYGEIINDADGLIVNLWRAVKHQPDEVAWWLEGPSTTVDLNARHSWVHDEGNARVARLLADPTSCCPQTAAWFVYGLSFACHPRAFTDPATRPGRIAKSAGQGPHAGWRQPIGAYLRRLSRRLSRAQVLCGDWTECVTPSMVQARVGGELSSAVGVFLDPPYAGALRTTVLYGIDDPVVAQDVTAWCEQWAPHRQMRIVLAGYKGEHDRLEAQGWRAQAWSSVAGGESRHDERLWFSPHCLRPDRQASLFDLDGQP